MQLMLPGFQPESHELPERRLWYCFNQECFYEHSLLDDFEILWIGENAMCPSCRRPAKRYEVDEYHGTL